MRYNDRDANLLKGLEESCTRYKRGKGALEQEHTNLQVGFTTSVSI